MDQYGLLVLILPPKLHILGEVAVKYNQLSMKLFHWDFMVLGDKRALPGLEIYA